MYRCHKCNKEFTRKNNMRRHQIQTCKAQENNVGDIINRVVERVNMDVRPVTETTPPYKPMIKEPTTEKLSKKPMTEVPIQAIKALKPKSLTDLAADIEMKSDSEDSSDNETEEEEEESEEESYEMMPDNPRELKEAFRNLYKKFRRDIEMYNRLVLMLDELKRMDCLTQEECNAMKDHLQNKLENRN